MGLGHLGLPGGQVLERSSWRLRLDGRGKGGETARAGPLPLPFPSVGPGGRPSVGLGGGGLCASARGRRAGVLALAGARQLKGAHRQRQVEGGHFCSTRFQPIDLSSRLASRFQQDFYFIVALLSHWRFRLTSSCRHWATPVSSSTLHDK